MLTLDLEPELEMTLARAANREHISANEFVKKLISRYLNPNGKESELLINVLDDLPEFPSFANQDPLQIQKALRDEWN